MTCCPLVTRIIGFMSITFSNWPQFASGSLAFPTIFSLSFAIAYKSWSRNLRLPISHSELYNFQLFQIYVNLLIQLGTFGFQLLDIHHYLLDVNRFFFLKRIHVTRGILVIIIVDCLLRYISFRLQQRIAISLNYNFNEILANWMPLFQIGSSTALISGNK